MLIALTLGGLFLGCELANPPVGAPPVGDSLREDAWRQAVKISVDVTQLQITWALALLGAEGFFLKNSVDKKFELFVIDGVMCLAVVLLATTSVFLGTLVFDHTGRLLAAEASPIASIKVRELSLMQYLCFLAAVLTFGSQTIQFFWRRIFAEEGIEFPSIPTGDH